MKRSDEAAAKLLSKRLKVKSAYPAPAWGDHNLNGITGRTTARPILKNN